MAGRFDLAGVGPGDPELMTIKTIRAIKACQVLVLPIGSPELKKPELEEGEEEAEDIREGKDETIDELVVTLQKLMK